MGTLLQILGNHELEFNSGKEAVKVFEERLNTKVVDGTYQSEKVKNKIDNLSEIEYFVAYDHLENNFNKLNEIKIMTNYKYCPEISLFKRVIRFDNGCKYPYWKNLILEEVIPKECLDQHEFCKVCWERIKSFSHELMKTFGGYKLVFFGDSRFQIEEDLYRQGKTLEVLIDEMSKKWLPTNFDEITLRKEEFNVKNGWYIQQLKGNTE